MIIKMKVLVASKFILGIASCPLIVLAQTGVQASDLANELPTHLECHTNPPVKKGEITSRLELRVFPGSKQKQVALSRLFSKDGEKVEVLGQWRVDAYMLGDVTTTSQEEIRAKNDSAIREAIAKMAARRQAIIVGPADGRSHDVRLPKPSVLILPAELPAGSPKVQSTMVIGNEKMAQTKVVEFTQEAQAVWIHDWHPQDGSKVAKPFHTEKMSLGTLVCEQKSVVQTDDDDSCENVCSIE